MNHYKRNNGALIGALGVVVAVTMTAALGLVVASQYTARRAPSVTPQQSDICVRFSCNEPSVPSAAVADEPELMRLDRANEHHG
jgi:hypothetical protein